MSKMVFAKGLHDGGLNIWSGSKTLSLFRFPNLPSRLLALVSLASNDVRFGLSLCKNVQRTPMGGYGPKMAYLIE